MMSAIEYFKCKNCGFTFSPTIFNLSEDEFTKFNIAFHQYTEDTLFKKNANQPPYIEQATMLNILEKNQLIDLKNSLDFAGGYGTLNKILIKYFNRQPLIIYDPYIQDLNNLEYLDKNKLESYNTVFNSAFFEHITCRQTLEEINSYVTGIGLLLFILSFVKIFLKTQTGFI